MWSRHAVAPASLVLLLAVALAGIIPGVSRGTTPPGSNMLKQTEAVQDSLGEINASVKALVLTVTANSLWVNLSTPAIVDSLGVLAVLTRTLQDTTNVSLPISRATRDSLITALSILRAERDSTSALLPVERATRDTTALGVLPAVRAVRDTAALAVLPAVRAIRDTTATVLVPIQRAILDSALTALGVSRAIRDTTATLVPIQRAIRDTLTAKLLAIFGEQLIQADSLNSALVAIRAVADSIAARAPVVGDTLFSRHVTLDSAATTTLVTRRSSKAIGFSPTIASDSTAFLALLYLNGVAAPCSTWLRTGGGEISPAVHWLDSLTVQALGNALDLDVTVPGVFR